MQIERLRQLRAELGKTQEEIAKLLKMPRVTYANYESGKREPDNQTLSLIADFFNVSVDYLLGRTPIKRYEYESNTFSISMEDLSEKDAELIQALIESLKVKNDIKSSK